MSGQEQDVGYFRGMFIRVSIQVLVYAALSTGAAPAQSFTQTIGGASAQDGVGAMLSSDGFRIGVRDHDPVTTRHLGQVYTMGAAGGFVSSTTLELLERTFLQDLINAPDGSAFLVGSVLTEPGNGHDGLLIKLSSTGAVLWTRILAAPGSQQYFSATALADGGAVVCGVNEAGAGHDALIARFSVSGDTLWTHIEPSVTDAEAHAIVNAGNDLIVTGRQANFSGTSDVLLLRLGMNGTPAWTTTIGGPENDEGRAIVTSGADTFIIAGWTDSYGAFDVTSQSRPRHAYLVAIDLEGDTLWTKAVGDTLYARSAFALASAPNGDLFLAGERYGSALSDALVARLTSSGSLIWERTLDTGKEERLTHLLALPDGFLGTGWSFGPFGRQVLFIRRNADGF